MKSLWNTEEAKGHEADPLALRVYTSRLIGQESSLVLQGGGNTSVKMTERDFFDDEIEVIYIKGSGWDLATIEKEGFAPVKMDALLKLSRRAALTDVEMVKIQRSAMTDPSAPSPSVEAILHAIIPYRYVDHTHADAIVTLTNTADGEKAIYDLFGNNLLIIPYVMPGFLLAKEVYRRTQGFDWSQCEGMVLLNHGVFTFDDTARGSYEKMIDLVSRAEKALAKKGSRRWLHTKAAAPISPVDLATMRKAVSSARAQPLFARADQSRLARSFASLSNLHDVAKRGTLTPDHVIRTKKSPVIFKEEAEKAVEAYTESYQKYFAQYATDNLTMLDPAPRWGVCPERGTIAFGHSLDELHSVSDINTHTMEAILQAEEIEGWQPVPEKELFDVEYWELEQAKLKKSAPSMLLQGKVAIVTGAASGIGRACVEELSSLGAAVGALDVNDNVISTFAEKKNILPLICDVTSEEQVTTSIETVVNSFGGIDIVISNAGTFPKSALIEEICFETWKKSLDINLTAHCLLWKKCVPFLSVGIDPIILVIASKNVPAPGPGAAAYSVAKAGLTQLARIAALELGAKGIRVNVIHPNAVFDTGIWTDKVIQQRAEQYGISPEEYKTNNILKRQIRSSDVAKLAAVMAGEAFASTTGAQIPIDGGNERVL
ncbi:bifunctional aldolase/short-chain dehydrogenase [Simkania negevensis]|uniref:Bifunctional aldolase/short-chain dehydrogenase n=1 Tax=Simkania negevensis TaxID=83561 RepID=A0ABS3AQG9_9BACT|nr:bifunctional aldolase/short-chain dehydrogenase [Simkania negevensis]